jgi:hypothetical protein
MPKPQILIDYALCQVDDVKGVMSKRGVAVPAGQVELYEHLINHFTVRFEQITRRTLTLTEYTEYHDGGAPFVRIAAPPVAENDADPLSPPIRVWEDSGRVFGDDSELTIWDDFVIGRGRNAASVRTRSGHFTAEPRAVKVVYTGGLVTAASGDDPEWAPPVVPHDLHAACAMQVAAWIERKAELNLSAVAMPGQGSVQLMDDPTKLLLEVRRTIGDYTITTA